MKKCILFAMVLLLTGCLATPVKRTFPDVPQDLLLACPNLATVDQNTAKLSDVLIVVADNYSQYHECRIKMDGWIEWYKTQRSIFETVK